MSNGATARFKGVLDKPRVKPNVGCVISMVPIFPRGFNTISHVKKKLPGHQDSSLSDDSYSRIKQASTRERLRDEVIRRLSSEYHMPGYTTVCTKSNCTVN